MESNKIRFYGGLETKSAFIQNAIGLIKLSRQTIVLIDRIPGSVDELIKKKLFWEKSTQNRK